MKFKMNTATPGVTLGYGIVPQDKRGIIKGSVQRTQRTGGDMTNAQFAKENGISKRQASRQRRGY